jgi:ribosomal-protein-alanine N-acetyltransferase
MNEEKQSLDITIRPMTISDIEPILRIERVSFPTPWPRDAFFYELSRPGRSICRVAELMQADGKFTVIGDIVIWLAGECAHVATLAVHPDYRSKGIASSLLAHALMASVDGGMKQALLEVRENNVRAQELYHKFGFEIDGTRHRYYQDTGEDAKIMVLKSLSAKELAEFKKYG